MVQELERVQYLYQETVVYQIASSFGDEFTYTNSNGNPAIRREVLDAFRALTKDTVIWERGSRLWRKREQYDEPGRRQS